VSWSCSAIDEGKVLLDVVHSWDKTMEPNWFATLIPSRPSGFSCSQVELPLLRHSWLLICSRVACRLACAHACGNEPSQPLAKHVRLHSRTRRFNSARTFAFASPRHTCPLCLREDRGLLAPGHLQILHEQFAVPSDLDRCFLLNGLRRSPRAAPLLPCESVRSRRTARRRPARHATAPPLPAAGHAFAPALPNM
jgi:hypothetical protein